MSLRRREMKFSAKA